ncbi:hypothetical protein FRC10_003580 [Ceratobasidium sp. 414]|nr:hypothetical protein FRC10_003580 [Ceratobasidium sp. 414]
MRGFLNQASSIAYNNTDFGDWKGYYVNWFVDRDMLMRYVGGGVGHYQQSAGGTTANMDEIPGASLHNLLTALTTQTHTDVILHDSTADKDIEAHEDTDTDENEDETVGDGDGEEGEEDKEVDVDADVDADEGKDKGEDDGVDEQEDADEDVDEEEEGGSDDKGEDPEEGYDVEDDDLYGF